jgi:DNA-binding IclR family transcriptional regulator
MNCTQVLAYTLLAACAAACAVIVSVDDGEILAGTSCASLGIATPCSKAKAAISMGIFAFVLLAFSAAISSQRLRA